MKKTTTLLLILMTLFSGISSAQELCLLTGDTDADGNPNWIYTYTYDANGNRLTQSNDSDADGNPNQVYTSTYDANNNQLTNSYDSDADGNFNSINTYTYDANNNRLTYSYDSGADGNPNQIITYTYDANNNLLTQSNDTDADGNPNQIYTWTYGSCALPVELVSLTGKSQDKTILIDWRTASEENNDGFEIERSSHQSDWKKLDFVKGYGTTAAIQNYKWVDRNPTEGINYYRLRQVDHDGAFEYSKTISVRFTSDQVTIQLYPTVARESMQLVTSLQQEYTVSVFNLLGEQLMEWSSTATEQVVDIDRLRSGSYLLMVSDGDRRLETFQFFKQ